MTLFRSYVWHHFEKADDSTIVVCKHCKGKLKFHKSTSSLRSHLELKHQEFDPQLTKTPTRTCSVDNQRTADTMFKQKALLQDERHVQLSKLLAIFIATNEQPFCLLEQESFRRLIHALNDRYVIPSMDTIKSLMVHEAKIARNEMRSHIKEIKYEVSACINIWPSDAHDSYLGVDIHHVTEDFKLEDFTLCVLPLEYPHTTERLAEILKRVFEEFELQEKIKSIVTDNCSNVLALKSYFPEIEFMQCPVHTFQLSVKSLLQANTDILAKSRKLVRHFAHSSKHHEYLLKVQEFSRPGEVPITYMGDTDVKWNSTHTMLKRILQLRNCVGQLVATWANGAKKSSEEWLSSLQPVLLSETDYSKAAVLVHLLDPLAYVSETLQANKYTAVSQIYPLARRLIHFYETPVEDRSMDEIRRAILKDLKERWSTPCEAHIIASFLNPRFKHLSFVEEPLRKSTIDRIRCLCEQEKASRKQHGQSAVPEEMLQSSACGNAMDLYFEDLLVPVQVLQEQNEVDLYLEMPWTEKLHKSFDVFAWWKIHESRLPVLSVLCRKYMCRTLSAASIESVFSNTGHVLGLARTGLEADMVNDLLVLKRFYSKV